MPKRPARKKRSRRSSNKKRPSTRKRTVLMVLLFSIATLFLAGYVSYKKLNREFASAFSSNSMDVLSKDFFTTAFLVIDDFEAEPLLVRKVSLYVLDKSTLKIIRYNIPTETVIDVPGKYSKEPFSNIMALGRMSGDDIYQSGQLMTDSIFKLLAFPVDRYVVVESGGENFFRGLFQGDLVLSNEKDMWVLKEMIKTNMDVRELYKVYTFANSLPEDRIWQKEVEGSYLDQPNLIDEEFMDLTFDSELSREKKNIAVLNGTEESGLANFGARVVKNFGGRVVAVGNSKSTYEKSVIITDDPISESTRILKQIFNIENVILYSEAHNFPESEINRSDVTIILGLDFDILL